MQTSLCTGTALSGYCTGPTEVQCCVTGSVVTAGKGFDISDLMTSTSASCFKNSGYTTVVARAWHSTGTIDTNGCSSLKAA